MEYQLHSLFQDLPTTLCIFCAISRDLQPKAKIPSDELQTPTLSRPQSPNTLRFCPILEPILSSPLSRYCRSWRQTRSMHRSRWNLQKDRRKKECFHPLVPNRETSAISRIYYMCIYLSAFKKGHKINTPVHVKKHGEFKIT